MFQLVHGAVENMFLGLENICSFFEGLKGQMSVKICVGRPAVTFYAN